MTKLKIKSYILKLVSFAKKHKKGLYVLCAFYLIFFFKNPLHPAEIAKKKFIAQLEDKKGVYGDGINICTDHEFHRLAEMILCNPTDQEVLIEVCKKLDYKKYFRLRILRPFFMYPLSQYHFIFIDTMRFSYTDPIVFWGTNQYMVIIDSHPYPLSEKEMQLLFNLAENARIVPNEDFSEIYNKIINEN